MIYMISWCRKFIASKLEYVLVDRILILCILTLFISLISLYTPWFSNVLRGYKETSGMKWLYCFNLIFRNSSKCFEFSISLSLNFKRQNIEFPFFYNDGNSSLEKMVPIVSFIWLFFHRVFVCLHFFLF